MTLQFALVAILVIAAAAGLFARKRAAGLRGGGIRLNSLPNYHALFVGLWTALPALLFLAAWTPVQSGLVEQAVLASPAGPLGQALIGARKGEQVTYQAPGGTFTVTVKAIRPFQT